MAALQDDSFTIIASEDLANTAQKITSCDGEGNHFEDHEDHASGEEYIIYGDQYDLHSINRTLHRLQEERDKHYLLVLCSFECIYGIFDLAWQLGLASKERAWLIIGQHTFLNTSRLPRNVLFFGKKTMPRVHSLSQFYKTATACSLSEYNCEKKLSQFIETRYEKIDLFCDHCLM